MTGALLLVARVWTGAGDPVGAVLIEDGVVAGLGTPAALRALYPAARVVELGEATATPGWTDAHTHPLAGSGMARGVELLGCTSFSDVAALLAAEHARLGPKDWLLAWGLDPNLLAGQPMDRGWLDAIVDERPAAVTLFDAHSMVVSSGALDGVDPAHRFSDASRIVTDASGRATGLLLESQAMDLVRLRIPPLTFEERAEHAAGVLDRMSATGFTGAQMLDLADADALELLDAIEATRDLPLRLQVLPWATPGDGIHQVERLLALQGRHGRRWRVGGVKLMIDGTIDNGTAWLREPDTHGESRAPLWLDPDEYAGVVARLHASNVPTTTHAIGDRGIEFVARVLRDLPTRPETGVRHRIEHVETLPDDVLAVLRAADIGVGMQPTHCTHYIAADGSDNWSRRLGPTRAADGFRTRDLRAAGLDVALGSDWPVAPSDARAIAAEARTRRRLDRESAEAVGPDQALAALEVLEGFTSHPWRSLGMAGGTLEIGAPADISVFAVDPLGDDPEAFAVSEVLLTLVGGEPVVDPRGLFR